MAFRGHKTAGQSVEHALHVSQARKGLNAMPNVLLQRAAVVGGMTKLLTLFFLVVVSSLMTCMSSSVDIYTLSLIHI